MSDFEDWDDEATLSAPRVCYQGEDTSPTTQRELNGWYAYPVAAEVFAVVAVGAFLPVVLEQLARENGVLFGDRTTPCVQPGGGSGSVSARAGNGTVGGDGKACQTRSTANFSIPDTPHCCKRSTKRPAKWKPRFPKGILQALPPGR